MHVCLDVGYFDEDRALAAAVCFETWEAARPCDQRVVPLDNVKPYVPGKFFERELPCLLSVIRQITEPVETMIIDGQVRLTDSGAPGLGMYLYEALDKRVPIIGVAKSKYRHLNNAIEITRGDSNRALYVTAAGIPDEAAAACIQQMHGVHRIPTLLKLVDQLSRGPEPFSQENLVD